MMTARSIRIAALACMTAISTLTSCVNENQYLGYGVVPAEEQFVTRTVKVKVPNIYMSTVDSLTGYNTYRIVVGAIQDTTFGLTRHGSAISLVPVSDTVKWGHNVRLRYFHLAASLDSISYYGDNNASIIQQVKVYPMSRPVDSTLRYSCEIANRDFAGVKPICIGTPTVNGRDSLSFNMDLDFARGYVPEEAMSSSHTEDVTQYFTVDSIDVYEARHYGIYICTDDPVGNDGRINFYDVNLSYNDDYYLTSYAALGITADYGKRKNVDTTIFFAFTPTAFNNEGSSYAFNTCETEYNTNRYFGESVLLHGSTPAYRTGDVVRIEGGTGYKPVVLAEELREVFLDAIADTIMKYRKESPEATFKSKLIVVNKATLSMFYDMPQDYEDMIYYPQVLNPTLRINNVKKDTVTYGSLTDSSVSDENQGEVDRANRCYKPNITHHLQEIMMLDPNDETDRKSLIRKDIWFLILANETVVVNSSSSSDSDYYSQLAYLNYYNSLMSGSYGGYSSYGSSYSNYYNYYMMMSYYNSASSGTSTSTIQTLDTDRYYNAVLKGPGAGEEYPTLEVTYSFLRKSE